LAEALARPGLDDLGDQEIANLADRVNDDRARPGLPLRCRADVPDDLAEHITDRLRLIEPNLEDLRPPLRRRLPRIGERTRPLRVHPQDRTRAGCGERALTGARRAVREHIHVLWHGRRL